MSDEEGSPIAVAKDFSGLREKDCDESLSTEVKISLNFALILLEEVSMMSLKIRNGEIFYKDSVLSVRHDGRLKLNVKVEFIKLALMKGFFAIGTID